MNSIRRRAYAAAYKGQNNQSVFNPFAARGRSHRNASDEEARVPSTQAKADALSEPDSDTGVSHGIGETTTVSPKPSESSLRRTHSAPNEASFTDALSGRAPGPSRAKLPEEPGVPEKPSIDDVTPMQIIVKPLTGHDFALNVTRNTTTEEIKKLIHEKKGTPLDKQRLVCKGSQLDPFKTLKDYNIQPADTLHVLLRLYGGGDGLDFVRFNSDEPPPKSPYTIYSQMRAILFNSWAHLLMLFIPAGFAVYYCHSNQIVVFTINFLAIIPSAIGLAIGVHDLSLRVGEILGGLIDMTFSNAVQIITSIFLLKQRHIDVLQTSLIGSILSNLLLMTGLGFFIGGLRRLEQYFNARVAQLLGSLLFLAAMSILVPTISPLVVNTSHEGILRQAHGTAIMLLLSYGCWLYFQLRSHAEMFREPSQHDPPLQHESRAAHKAMGVVGAKAAVTVGGSLIKEHIVKDQPQLTAWTAIGTIVISTVLIAFNAQFATESINSLLDQAGLTPTFVGLVILPLLSTDPTTLIDAYKDNMDLSLQLTLGKCMQTALMVVPLVVIIGWGMGVEDMTLQFNGFEVASLFASILIVNHIVQDGRSTWYTDSFVC